MESGLNGSAHLRRVESSLNDAVRKELGVHSENSESSRGKIAKRKSRSRKESTSSTSSAPSSPTSNRRKRKAKPKSRSPLRKSKKSSRSDRKPGGQDLPTSLKLRKEEWPTGYSSSQLDCLTVMEAIEIR